MSDGQQFKYLFSPLKLRGVVIPNRIASPPHGVHMADFHSFLVTDRLVAYYEERAKGGIGLIIAGGTFIHPTSMKRLGCNQVWDDSAIPGLKILADAVHKYGTKIFGQLSHTGRQGTSDPTGYPLWAPSPIPCPLNREVPHEMETEEIEELVEATRQAARRFKEAGFDGVEIYAGQGYLLSEFLSPYSNARTDEYGGTFKNRMRIVYEVIDAVRDEVGKDYAVGIRLIGDEFTEGGLGVEDAKQIAKAVEATGKIDYINQGHCNYSTFYTMCPDMSFPLAPFTYIAAELKQVVEIPVFTVASITDPVLAEKILAEGQADAVCMARGLVSDPELPKKAREGRLDEIRNCICCNEGCIGRIWHHLPMGCVQNPAVGYERELGIGTMKPAGVRKKVMVIGGGPAGLKAAEVAAERGHQVTVYEKSNELGGQVLIAAKAPKRELLASCVTHLAKQFGRLGVEAKLGVEVTPEMVEREKPDAVVVATGSIPELPPIPGADGGNVYNTWQVLNEEVDVGNKVVIVDGGEAHLKFCTTADFLAERGKKVEMITHISSIGMEIEAFTRVPLLMRLGRNKVKMSPSTELKEVRGRTVVVADVWSGEERTIEDVDSVVFAWYHQANNSLYRSLKGKVKELYAVGDCLAPRKIQNAIRDGFVVGRKL